LRSPLVPLEEPKNQKNRKSKFGTGDVQVVEPPDAIKTVLVRWNNVKDEVSEENNKCEKKLSKEILSILLVASADPYLQQMTKSFICITEQTVKWDALFKLPLTESHKAAITWAYCIWKNEIPQGCNPFLMSSLMSPELKKVILEALKFRWLSPSCTVRSDRFHMNEPQHFLIPRFFQEAKYSFIVTLKFLGLLSFH
jgi:hypothetical protein